MKSTTHPPKITGEAIERQIQKLQSDIAAKCAQLNEQECLLSDYAESLRLVEANTPWLPPTGTLAPLDAFQKHLQNCENEREREAKITEFRAGQRMALQVYGRLEEELRELRSQLGELEEELIWQRDYAQFAVKYELAFPRVPSAEERRDLAVARMEENIRQHQLRLQKAQDWLRRAEEKQSKSPNLYLEAWSYVLPAPEVTRNYPSIIAQMQASLASEKERVVPDGRDPKVERDFREFVKARASIERSLQQFLQVQAEYKRALAEFRQVASKNPRALNFPLAQLPDTPITSVGIRNNEVFVEIDETARSQARRRSW